VRRHRPAGASTGDITAGLDWATADHAVAIVNGKGTVIELRASPSW
jgi:hypothetical protein